MVAPPHAGQPPASLAIGDVLRLRKSHACGGDRWVVRRLGADIGLTCRTCGRHILMERPVLERRLVAIVERAGLEADDRPDPDPAPAGRRDRAPR